MNSAFTALVRHRWLRRLVAITTALLVNSLLIVIIPVLQSILGLNTSGRDGPIEGQRRVIEFYAQPQPEKKVKPQPQPPKPPSRARLPGDAATHAMSMRFSPDLSVADGSGPLVQGSQDLQAMVFREGETDEDVIPLRTDISYPERARDLEIQGSLIVEIVIGIDGRVESMEIVRSPHPLISEAARQSVRNWRFKPARKNGIPVRLRARKQFDFTLE